MVAHSEPYTADRRVRAHVVQLAVEVPNAVRADERRDLDRAQDPERNTVRVEERAAGVPWDAGCRRVHVVAPAVAVVAQADALLRAQLADAPWGRPLCPISAIPERKRPRNR